MSFGSTLARVRRLARKRPGYLLDWAARRSVAELDRWLAPRRERTLDIVALAGVSGIDELWSALAQRPFPAVTAPAGLGDRLEPGERERILAAAQKACDRTVDLLGSGPIRLGTPIDWSRDHRVNLGWPTGFARSIDYINRDRPSDVKIPWEISRLQWPIPAGQAFVLTGDEKYAAAVRDILAEWIAANPLAYTVNWSCAMEAALRIVTWTWLFHVFARSDAWRGRDFRTRFLSVLYLHADFTLRHIEKAEVNGNHYTSDLTGLVCAGLLFGDIGAAPRWSEIGWSGLCAEIARQVHPDGVVHEASCAYHRLVFELFAWSALFREAAGHAIPDAYRARLRKMTEFTAAYARPDGTTPLWGDADDARALPFGGQPVNDHRYMVGFGALVLGEENLAAAFDGPRSELRWIFGGEKVSALPGTPSPPHSNAFPHGGCYVMRDATTHVFIDCGPVGLGGRGGHGHNDALSFEAWLDSTLLVTDCGSYVYTSSFEERNRFRGTRSHNTPMVDGEEINRFLHPDALWDLHDDARPECLQWRGGDDEDIFVGAHRGYERLGVEVRRTIRWDRHALALHIADELTGEGTHSVVIPLHLAPNVTVERLAGGVTLRAGGKEFVVTASDADGWTLDIEPCRISPSYGVAVASQRLVWSRTGVLPAALTVTIRPQSGS